MTPCFFVSDLHGRIERYERLFERIALEQPRAVFLGGDLLPSGLMEISTFDISHSDFINDRMARPLARLRDEMQDRYPDVFVILGNDDGRFSESAMLDVATRGIWHYVHNRVMPFGDFTVYGYACVPPTPFLLKDWERYDVSRYVDPGCLHPTAGRHSVPLSDFELKYGTIKRDLEQLVGDDPLDRAIMLFHSPPHQTKLDRAALDGKTVDHAPVDVHVGSIAIRRLIESHQPLLTLHGHVHESAGITGAWLDKIGATVCLSAAHDGDELALVRFDPTNPEQAERELL